MIAACWITVGHDALLNVTAVFGHADQWATGIALESVGKTRMASKDSLEGTHAADTSNRATSAKVISVVEIFVIAGLKGYWKLL